MLSHFSHEATLWTLSDPVDYNLPGSSVHGILQARILECVAMPSPEDLPNSGIEPETPAAPALPPGSPNTTYQRSKVTFVSRRDEKDQKHISHLWSIKRRLTHGQKSCLFHKCVLT